MDGHARFFRAEDEAYRFDCCDLGDFAAASIHERARARSGAERAAADLAGGTASHFSDVVRDVCADGLVGLSNRASRAAGGASPRALAASPGWGGNSFGPPFCAEKRKNRSSMAVTHAAAKPAV